MVFWPDLFSEEKISYSPIRFIDGVNPVKPVAPPDKKDDKPIKETDPVKKENKKAFVLISVTQVEQIPNVKQFNL